MQSPYRVNYRFSLEPKKKINWLSLGVRVVFLVPCIVLKGIRRKLTFMEKVY